ncbi:MAG: hypothetical protein K0U47_12650 [Epsilonproteobacteria bacterium]|nr:hypothetical protein [Campylobacterota bacterium]
MPKETSKALFFTEKKGIRTIVRRLQESFTIVKMVLLQIFVLIVLLLGYGLQWIGVKIDLKKSLNFFGLGLSDSDPEPLNQDVRKKYKDDV